MQLRLYAIKVYFEDKFVGYHSVWRNLTTAMDICWKYNKENCDSHYQIVHKTVEPSRIEGDKMYVKFNDSDVEFEVY